jgi:predicted component of type VI protein secretion system
MGLKTRSSLESSPPMSAHLKDAEGKHHELGTSCVLGRMPDCSIQLAGARVSRRHALVHSMDGVQHWVVDLGSTNGVLVNGHRIQQPQALRDGDEIRVGDNRLVFHADSPHLDAVEQLHHQLKTARAEAGVSALNYGIVVVGANSRPQFITARAREWLVVISPKPSATHSPTRFFAGSNNGPERRRPPARR